MCDVIKIRLKRRDARRNRKGNQPLDIKTDVERPILKIELEGGAFILSYFSLHPSLLDEFLWRHT